MDEKESGCFSHCDASSFKFLAILSSFLFAALVSVLACASSRTAIEEEVIDQHHDGIIKLRQGSGKWAVETIEVKHPDKLYGKPEIPELKTDAWYVLAADVRDKIDGLRLAAIINHQGPQIPARVLSKSDNHRVIAGPFNDISEAKDAVKRLKIDLEIEGILIEPVKKK